MRSNIKQFSLTFDSSYASAILNIWLDTPVAFYQCFNAGEVWRPQVWTSSALKFTTISMEGVRRIIEGNFDASVVMDAPRFRSGMSTDGTRAKDGSMCSFVVLIEDTRENSETAPRFRLAALPPGLSADGARAKVGICMARENSETFPTDCTRVRVLSARLGMLASLMLPAESALERVLFKLPGFVMRALAHSCLDMVLQRAGRGVSVSS